MCISICSEADQLKTLAFDFLIDSVCCEREYNRAPEYYSPKDWNLCGFSLLYISFVEKVTNANAIKKT